jgi:hypothetical protein
VHFSAVPRKRRKIEEGFPPFPRPDLAIRPAVSALKPCYLKSIFVLLNWLFLYDKILGDKRAYAVYPVCLSEVSHMNTVPPFEATGRGENAGWERLIVVDLDADSCSCFDRSTIIDRDRRHLTARTL